MIYPSYTTGSRAPVATIGGFPRPLLNISTQNFATTFNEAVGYELEPPFEPYANTINYLLASNAIPHVGLVCYICWHYTISRQLHLSTCKI